MAAKQQTATTKPNRNRNGRKPPVKTQKHGKIPKTPQTKGKTSPAKKTRGKGTGRTGRPKFKIDYEKVKALAGIHCTQEEIAMVLGCSVDTLQRDAKFCGLYKESKNTGKVSLRRILWKGAQAGNASMAIWLSKQYLGMKDKHDHSSDDGSMSPVGNTFDVSKMSTEALKELMAARVSENSGRK